MQHLQPGLLPKGGLDFHPHSPPIKLWDRFPDKTGKLTLLICPLVKNHKYLLTLVHTFMGRVETFPTTSEKAAEVTHVLLDHIIPCFGIPTSMQSDNGPAFISQIIQKVGITLKSRWKLHIPHHPQSSSKIEKANSTLKTQPNYL